MSDQKKPAKKAMPRSVSKLRLLDAIEATIEAHSLTPDTSPIEVLIEAVERDIIAEARQR